ncbi:hypothetical protein BaRGS_00026258 [Batillaria attramentaria]|uniref:Uncharacterized protein n=1 Tax=Batillaria attramentaria TaxID=370345 RepID=A0ABD0K646_9CAEN
MQNGTGDNFHVVDLPVKAPAPAADEATQKKGPPSWGEAWVEFTQNTTIHGLRFIWMEQAFLFRKFLWLILVCACAVVMGVQIVDRIIYYQKNPVTVNVNVNFNKSLVFPSLTICNQNSFRATMATELGRYRLLEAMYTGKGDLNSSTLNYFNASDVTLDDLALSTAHSKYDLIVACEWQNEKCGPENFTQVLTDHGVCFTFNDKEKPLFVASTGSEYGLKLTLNVEQYEYMPGPHDAAGVKMLLHDRKEFPGVAELGLSIPTGTHAYVGIQVVSIHNLPEPHGDCGSLWSPFYKDYSADNCQLACLTDYMDQACGCRHPHMPSRNGTPPICTLEQYYGCYSKEIGRLKAKVRSDCACPIPCRFLIFDPALSFATTSVFATDRLIAAASHSNDLETKYLRALEVTHRMEGTKFNSFVEKEEEARTRLEELSLLMLKVVREAILSAEDTVVRLYNDTKRAWERKNYLYRWQEYHINKNFIRARDAMSERTFEFLCAGFQEYATLTESNIWSLVDPEVVDNPDVTQALYTLVMKSLAAKMDLADRAYANYTQLYDAYYNGTPVFRYMFESEPRDMNIYITPKPLLRNSLLHSDYATKYSSRLVQDIVEFKQALGRFAELATTAYLNKTLDKHDMYLADVEFMYRGRRYLHSKSTFFYESIEYPLRVMQGRIAGFDHLWRSYETAVQATADDVASLKQSLANLEDTILRRLNLSMGLAQKYVQDGNVTKLDVARELTSQNIYEGISDLKVFFQSLSMTEFSRNASEVAREIREDYDNYRKMFDFRYLVGNADSKFLKSLEDLMNEMERYIELSVIEIDFIRENILQLDVFYREKSYEQITQQEAYDIFALFCDIGGSMGLFVGASVMSIGELLDLFLHQSVYRITHKARN